MALVLGAILSVQLGSAAATATFDEVGPAGTALYRLLFAAVLLTAFWRPGIRDAGRGELLPVVFFGLILAGMNLCFYEAIDRIPLGIAVAFEFVGPLAVAIGGSRRRLDLLWVALAAAGIVLLAGPMGSSPDALGVALALVAGGFWGTYILVAARVGRTWPGGGGLALAMAVGAAIMIVPGLAAGGSKLFDPEVAAVGLAVAVLSSVVPYSLELEALRRLPVAVFGVLMSIEPAVAALIGLVALAQGIPAAEAVGIALVVCASAGALHEPGPPATTP